MHAVIATDGQMDAELAAAMASRLAGPDGRVTVLTIVEIPRTLLRDLRVRYTADAGEAVTVDRSTVDVRPTGEPGSWPGEDAVIARYLRDKSADRTSALVDALAARGITATVDAREGERVATDILEAVAELDVDVLCVGAHGAGRFEGLLGSTSTKIARHSPCPVLLLRN